MWRKLLCVLSAYAIFIAGCGGHNANPVDRYMLGDEKKSCNALYGEVANIDKEIALKNREKTDRDIWNVIFFVTGFLVIVPWFFIDGKGAPEVEMEALKARKNALQILHADKNCGTPAESVAVARPPAAAPIAAKAEPVENLGRFSNQVETNTPTNDNLKVVNCENCGRAIGKLEMPYPYKGNVVCYECFQKLKKRS
jgi:hypothetical protein